MWVLTWIISVVGKLIRWNYKRSSVQVSATYLREQQSLQDTTVGCAEAYMQIPITQENILVDCVGSFFFGTVFVKHNHRRTHTHRSPVVQTQTDRIDDWGRRMKVWKWVGRETCNVRGVSTTHSPAMYVPSPLSASSCEQYTLAHRSCHQISKNHIKPWLSGWCVAAVNGAHWSRGVAKCVRASV